MAKRYIAFVMAIITIVTCLSACSTSGTTEEPVITTQQTTKKETDNTSFKLSYTQGDSLDPFKAKTQNNQILASLVFESLFDLDEKYEPVTNIATKYEYTDDTTIKVTIKNDIEFSNGSRLTASDVKYSFDAAQESPAYKNALDCFSYATIDDGTIYFYLKHSNPYAINLLTFPIACINDDEDGYPVGSGRYYYKSEDDKTVLKANTKNGFNPYFTTVNLVNIAAADSIDNAVNIGNISYAFRDLSSSVAKRMNCAKKLVTMNNLVYIGINSIAGIGANTQIRQAISLACDRSAFVETAYSGYATSAASPFNPVSSIAANVKIFSDEADTATARQIINQSGVDPKNMKLTILVNANNNREALATLLKSQLEAVGFAVSIDKVNSKEYIRRVKHTEFDIYIGEVKLGDDMSLYPFFSKSGGVHYGIDRDLECGDLYKDFLSGDADLGKFILKFNDEMPFVPLLYKKGMICYSKAMHGDMQGYYGNFFSNIDSWSFNK